MIITTNLHTILDLSFEEVQRLRLLLTDVQAQAAERGPAWQEFCAELLASLPNAEA